VSRDRILISTIVAAAILAGFWIGILGPKRAEAGKLSEQLATQQDRLSKAQAGAAQANAARARYNADYSAVATLGKAVPSTDGVPSLLYQIDSAAHGAKIDFETFTSSGAAASGAAATATPATPAPASGTSGTSGSTAAPATGAATGTTATPATATASTPAPMPLSFAFAGSFLDMQRLVDRLNRFVQINGTDVRVSGRLLSVNDISLAPDAGGRTVKATISALAYTMPAAAAVSGTSSPAATGSGATAAAPAASTATANAAGANG
jgi:Tfp pilus assembly protein PilO